LILLLVAAVIIATNVIDPNHYKRNIEAIVGDLTGSPFEIRGDLALTWYPGSGCGRARRSSAIRRAFRGPL